MNDNEQTLCDNQQVKAENAFSQYNFGGSIISSRSWQESGETWNKQLKIKYSITTDLDTEQIKDNHYVRDVLFVVMFGPNSDEILGVSAWDERTGHEVGYLKSFNRPNNSPQP